MKFLVDAQLPAALCRWLCARGHDAEHVKFALRQQAEDSEIAAFAEKHQLVLVTKDSDFATIFPPGNYQLLWLKCGNIDNPRLAVWLEARWQLLEDLLEKGERLVEAE